MTNNTWVLEMIRDRDCRTDAERDVMNMAINSLSVIEDIKTEIFEYLVFNGFGTEYRNDILSIVDKHITGKEFSQQ